MSSEPINWPHPSADWLSNWQIASGAQKNIQVFSLSLDVSSEVLSRFKSVLAASELERAARFHFEHHRNRFIVGRGFLRLILGCCLGAKPAELEFIYGSHGKPSLGGTFAGAGLHFNLAHSEGLGLLALSSMGMVGVDVEQIRPIEDMDTLVNRFFSRREKAAFQEVPELEKTRAFFNLWTRKEAFLKAVGTGIAHSLDQVEVSFQREERAELLHLPPQMGKIIDWHLHELTPATGYVGALIASGTSAQPNCRNFDPIFEFLSGSQI